VKSALVSPHSLTKTPEHKLVLVARNKPIDCDNSKPTLTKWGGWQRWTAASAVGLCSDQKSRLIRVLFDHNILPQTVGTLRTTTLETLYTADDGYLLAIHGSLQNSSSQWQQVPSLYVSVFLRCMVHCCAQCPDWRCAETAGGISRTYPSESRPFPWKLLYLTSQRVVLNTSATLDARIYL
jgi:hypothetical protein